MNKLEKSIQKNSFNEEQMLMRIQAQTLDMKSRSNFGGTSMKKVIGVLVISVALVFAIWFGFNQNNGITVDPVVMLVGIDINPSFELSVNKNDVVVEIEALNEDAKTMVVSDLVNQSVDDVVEEIIRRSAQAGFIDVNDLEDDYVVVSSVSLTDDELDQDQLQNQLEKRIRESDFLQSLNVVQIKATQVEKFEADGKNVPVGLYVINGAVLQADGTFLSAKEFFSNPENRDVISNRSNITVEKQEKLHERIETALSKLEEEGFIGVEYRNRLENATYDQLLQIQAELKIENKRQNKNNETDDSQESDGSEITEPRGNSNVLPKASQNAGKKK